MSNITIYFPRNSRLSWTWTY